MTICKKSLIAFYILLFYTMTDSLYRSTIASIPKQSCSKIFLIIFTQTEMLFIPNVIARMIINVFSLALCIFMFYRMFSKNISRRTAENQKYLRARRKIKEWFLLRRNKWKYRKTHVYRKCPHCGVQIRLPRVKGEHRCACPKCGDSFGVNIK